MNVAATNPQLFEVVKQDDWDISSPLLINMNVNKLILAVSTIEKLGLLAFW